MTDKIVIYGAGGFARETLQIIRDINRYYGRDLWNPLGYLVDEEYITTNLINGLPILGSSEWLRGNHDVFLIIAVGSPSLRKMICEKIEVKLRNRFAKIIHPRAWVGDYVEIGQGSIICAGTLITANIHIGQHAQVNIGSTIGHDSMLGDFVTLNPSVNISGNVKVDMGCEIGTGSVLIPNAHVGEWSIVGAGSVVTKTLPANVTAVGAPARTVKIRAPGWHRSQTKGV